jgi:cytochrome b561
MLGVESALNVFTITWQTFWKYRGTIAKAASEQAHWTYYIIFLQVPVCTVLWSYSATENHQLFHMELKVAIIYITCSYDLLGLLKLAELEGQAGSRD